MSPNGVTSHYLCLFVIKVLWSFWTEWKGWRHINNFAIWILQKSNLYEPKLTRCWVNNEPIKNWPISKFCQQHREIATNFKSTSWRRYQNHCQQNRFPENSQNWLVNFTKHILSLRHRNRLPQLRPFSP